MRILLCLVVLPTLIACATPAAESEGASGKGGRMPIRSLSATEAATGQGTVRAQRALADRLFAGLQALDADRLLTPAKDNAYAHFQGALAQDPDNAIALQGLQDIVVRYLELAEEAGRQGLFDEAATLLDRARFVDTRHPAIDRTARAILAEQNSNDRFFDFELAPLTARTAGIRHRLRDVAQQAREHNAFFLITAPSDELARWMFSVMRDAVPGYRLRGNIELASRAGIRLKMPTASR